MGISTKICLLLAYLSLSGSFSPLLWQTSGTQGWTKQDVTDPMTSKSYIAYTNTGVLLNESAKAHVHILCKDGKYWRGSLSIEGLAFHYDSYASLRSAAVTAAAIKVGSKIDHRNFLVSQDMRQAFLSKGEVGILLKAVSPIIQFSDTFGTPHYATFNMADPPEEFRTECGNIIGN